MGLPPQTLTNYCPQAGQAFTFFAQKEFIIYLSSDFRFAPIYQQKKVNKDLTRPSGTLSKGRGKRGKD